MTDADIAIYDKAFAKQDKDKDGFVSLDGQCCWASIPSLACSVQWVQHGNLVFVSDIACILRSGAL